MAQPAAEELRGQRRGAGRREGVEGGVRYRGERHPLRYSASGLRRSLGCPPTSERAAFSARGAARTTRPRCAARLAQAVAREGGRHLVGLLAQQPGGDQPVRRAREARGDLEQQPAHEVGGDGRRPRRGLGAQVGAAHLELDPVDGGVLRRRLERGPVEVDGEHGAEAEPRGGDGEHARAAAPVGQRAARRALEQQPEREPGARVPARAEGAARLDDELEVRGGIGGLPRRAHAQAPAGALDLDGRWKLRQRSAQSSGTAEVMTSTSAPPAAARTAPMSGTSPAAP